MSPLVLVAGKMASPRADMRGDDAHHIASTTVGAGETASATLDPPLHAIDATAHIYRSPFHAVDAKYRNASYRPP